MSSENNIEQYQNYVFIRPPVMVDGDLEVKLARTNPYNPLKEWVPSYKFAMINTVTRAVMGDIDLRVGLTAKLKMMGGHIGYEVFRPYRGHRYATRSCRLLLPFAASLGINPVVITCDPENIPSVKTIEALGAELIKTHKVEIEPGVFRWTNVYHLTPS